jgi:predicted DsbA family dithiol-disulfide isomerase
MKTLRIDIWSDIACPWCYVGKRRLEAALARFRERNAVEVVWRAFELDPSAPGPRPRDEAYAARLARKYGCSLGEAEAMVARMTRVGAADGLTLRFDRIQRGNTFDAHRLLHLARERGRQDAVKERLLRGYFTDGEAIADRETLVRLGAEAGLEPGEVGTMLASGAYADAVRIDESEAETLGIGGVPFFVLAGRYAVSGAQPSELLLGALERAAGEADAEHYREGATCGPEGCN